MKLLLTGAFKYTQQQLERISSLGHEIIFIKDERDPIEIDVSEIEAVICNSLFHYNDITKFKSLKYIQIISAGLDRIPLDYIKEHNIKLFNASGVYSPPIAEWVILKILEIYKKSRYFYKNQDAHKWEKHRDLLELTDKTASIIGFGSIGTEVAKRLKAFDVKIISVDMVNIETELSDEQYMINDMKKALQKSDIIILTLPLTGKTHHLINLETIENMKDNNVLVNVSRGSIIDEKALIDAVKKDKFLGVALDVFEEEPLISDSSLWDFEKVIITPHNSFVSDKIKDRMFECIEENLRLIMKI